MGIGQGDVFLDSFLPVCGSSLGSVRSPGSSRRTGTDPKKSLPAFSRALTIGVTTLELDVGVSADGTVMVSHGSTLTGALTRRPSGVWLYGHGAALISLTDNL